MKKSDYYKSLIISLGILLYGSSAEALIPTVDFSAIAEGVKTNIELVKQSKIVVEATKLTGEIKSTVGSAKSALSDLENSEVVQELKKAQKEVENLREAAKIYEEYKEKIEQEKEKLEKKKEKLNKIKDKVTNAYTTVKDTYDDAKEFYDEAKATYDEVKTAVDTYAPQVQNAINTVQSFTQEKQTNTEPSTVSTPQTITYDTASAPQTQPTSTSTNESQELQDAKAEIEQLKAALAALMTQNEANMETTEQTDADNITDLEEAKAEIEKLKAELEKYQQAETETEAQTPPTTDSQNVKEEETTSQTEEKTNSAEETTTQTRGSFRKIPQINTNDIFDKTSWIEDKEIFTASRTYKEVLQFAKEETAENQGSDLSNTPTGKNTKTDEFIMSDELAQYCGINVNNASESEISDCVKKLIEYRSSSNATEAEKAEKLIKKVLYDTSTALAAESMSTKVKSGNYKDEVIAEKQKSESQAQTTVRDDINVLSSNVALLQELMSNINKIYASRLMADSLREATKYKLQDIGETPSTATTGTSTGEE